MLVSLVFLGIALFSALINIKSNRIIWLLGLVVLFAGAYVAYSAKGVSFWSESIVSNTTVLGLSMMFYIADEQEDMIDRYLQKGKMYVLNDNGVKCDCIITDEGNGVLEIKNIATVPEYQGKG